jgi:hypothetical protein
MHVAKLPALAGGAGGAPPLLFPVVREASPAIREERVEIGDRTDIGRAICSHQALLNGGESLRLRFIDGGAWVGSVTMTREDNEDLAVTVTGSIFNGKGDDRGVTLSFRCEPDGPIGLPIVARDCDGMIIGIYTDDDEDPVSAETIKAAFFASGVGERQGGSGTQKRR